MRIVLDTNVVISALIWRGTPYHFFEHLRARSDIELYTSAPLLSELAEVLARPAISRRLDLIGRSAREILLDYAELTEIVTRQPARQSSFRIRMTTSSSQQPLPRMRTLS